jgi:hypothetical protein
MTSVIFGAIDKISSLLRNLQVKQFLSVILIGLVLLTVNADPGVLSKQEATQKVDKMLSQDDGDRPKTTGEWQKQAREVEGKPGERVKRIGEQSADAIKDFGSIYPDVAKRSAKELENNTKTTR